MSSLRKRYQSQFASPERDSEAPVTTAPPTQAAAPPPAVEPKPEEPAPEIETKSPAEEAAHSAIKARIAEMERAEALARQGAQQPPQASQQQQPPTVEQMIAHLPERVQRWYRAHPEFLTNPEKAAQVQYCHHVAAREVGEQFTEPYFDRMELLLGLRQQPQTNGGNGHERPSIEQPRVPAPQQRPQPRPMGANVSAPPTREVPSFSTGRPVGRMPPLSKEELEVAAACGQTPEQYQAQKARMLKAKAEGAIQDGR